MAKTTKAKDGRGQSTRQKDKGRSGTLGKVPSMSKGKGNKGKAAKGQPTGASHGY